MHDDSVLNTGAAIADLTDFVFSHLQADDIDVGTVTIREVVAVMVMHRVAVAEIVLANTQRVDDAAA